MQKRHITLLLGELVVVINPPFIHLSTCAEPSRRALEKLGPPRLFRGKRARHVTIPLEPLDYGPDAGKFNIHLTYSDGRRDHHETVAMLTSEAIAAAFKPIADATLDQYLRVVQRVTIEQLRKDGYGVLLPSDEAEAWIDEHAEMRRWQLRVKKSTFQRMAEHLEIYDPEIMDELRMVDEYKEMALTLVREGDEQALSVGFQPRGLGPERPPGWYATPVDHTIGDVMDAVAPASFGPAFYEALIVIARELQADLDIEAVERARRQAATARS
jgi:hypothetical protein